MFGECSVEGFVWGSRLGGDRVDLVLRRSGDAIVPKPPRPLARWSLDLLYLAISLLVNQRTNETQQSTVDWRLVRNRGWYGGTCGSSRAESTVDLQQTHILYREIPRSCSGDHGGVFCRRIRLGESFRWRSSRIGVAPFLAAILL